MMTYLALIELASQREERIAATARLPRPDATPPGSTTRRTRSRHRVAARARAMVTRS